MVSIIKYSFFSVVLFLLSGCFMEQNAKAENKAIAENADTQINHFQTIIQQQQHQIDMQQFYLMLFGCGVFIYIAIDGFEYKYKFLFIAKWAYVIGLILLILFKVFL